MSCAQLMLFLSNDILDLGRKENMKLELNISRVSIKVIINECIDILGFMAEQKGIELKGALQ